MTALAAYLSSLCCCLFVGLATEVLHARCEARKLSQANRRARTLQAPPPASASVEGLEQPSALEPMPLPPARPVPARAPSFTSFEVSDLPPLVQRCVCGKPTMHVGLLTSHSICTSCCRAWSVVRGRSFFMPLAAQSAFAEFNHLSFGSAKS